MRLFLLERSLASPGYRHLIFIGLECAMNSHRASRLLKDLRTMSIGLGPIRRLHFRRAIRERESRSEERRVGKECRSGGEREKEKKKRKESREDSRVE